MKFFIASAEKATAKNGSEFLRLQLIDENKRSQEAVWFDPIKVDVSGKVCEVELRMPANSAHKPAIAKLEVLEGADSSAFIKRSAYKPAQVFEWFKDRLSSDSDVCQVVNDIVFSRQAVLERFAEWPAAKGMHHAFAGGLMEHTYAMGIAAEFYLNNDPAYQGLDIEVVYAAILLHDIAKLSEYDWEAPGPASRTDKGVLLGHITMADEAIVKSCVRLNLPTTKGRMLKLRHCVLSHHGKRDWGSPVAHGTREAVLIHQLDMTQSRGQMALEADESLAPGEFVTIASMDCVLYKLGDATE